MTGDPGPQEVTTGRLDGKIAIVTGAAMGQGAAIARRFAAEGASVVLADVADAEGEAVRASIGRHAIYQHHDVSNEDSWRQTVAASVAAFGGVNVLVNNAGIIRWGPLEEHATDDYMAVVRVNQLGCFLGMRAVVEPMKRAGGGSIVNTASTAGLEGNAGTIGYVASKFAIRGMTKTAALELGRYNIRVNAVCPGGIDTRMSNPSSTRREDLDAFYRRNPIPRIGTPEEIASIMVFLASDESSYCTGADFVVDGGYTCGQNPMRI